jgi:hypothetical protein
LVSPTRAPAEDHPSTTLHHRDATRQAAAAPHQAALTFCENLRRLNDGRPPLALIDKQKGY